MRDITNMENMHEAIQNNKLLHRIYQSLAPDLISPFQSINYLCDVMLESGPSLDQTIFKRNCTLMKSAAELASFRTKNFLDLKSIQERKFFSNQSVFNPYIVVREIFILAEQHLRGKQLVLKFRNEEAFWVKCDKDRFKQVVLSMLGRAIDLALR